MTFTQRGTWIDLLEASCVKASITCLDIIIDQAGSNAPLLPSVVSVQPSLTWYS
jgi:hypothetical protein